MAATAERPNFLLLWIGLVVLVMTAGLRALIPETPPFRAREASGGVPQPPPDLLPSTEFLAEPVPELTDDPLAPLQDPNVLVNGSSSEPGFQRLHPEGPEQTGAAATLASAPGAAGEQGRGVSEPSQLERLEPAPLVNGIRPRPAHAGSSTPERSSRSSDPVAVARPVLVSFHSPSSTSTEEDSPATKPKLPVAPEQALIVQLAPDAFRAVLIVEAPAVEAAAPIRGTRDPAAGARSGSEPEAESADGGDTEDERTGADAGAAKRAFLSELRQWLQSRAGREDLTPETLLRIRAELERRWPGHQAEFQRLLIVDLDRRGLAQLLEQLAARAQSRAG